MTTFCTITSLFDLEAAKSKGLDDYDRGTVPFVTSTELNNGVVSYVEPEEGDKVFDGPALVVSGLGHASVQPGRFLPKGNGGDSLTVLTPRDECTTAQLVEFAASFNVLHKWRFSFGRKCSVKRLADLKLPVGVSLLTEALEAEKTLVGETLIDVDLLLQPAVPTAPTPHPELAPSPGD